MRASNIAVPFTFALPHQIKSALGRYTQLYLLVILTNEFEPPNCKLVQCTLFTRTQSKNSKD